MFGIEGFGQCGSRCSIRNLHNLRGHWVGVFAVIEERVEHKAIDTERSKSNGRLHWHSPGHVRALAVAMNE